MRRGCGILLLRGGLRRSISRGNGVSFAKLQPETRGSDASRLGSTNIFFHARIVHVLVAKSSVGTKSAGDEELSFSTRSIEPYIYIFCDLSVL